MCQNRPRIVPICVLLELGAQVVWLHKESIGTCCSKVYDWKCSLHVEMDPSVQKSLGNLGVQLCLQPLRRGDDAKCVSILQLMDRLGPLELMEFQMV